MRREKYFHVSSPSYTGLPRSDLMDTVHDGAATIFLNVSLNWNSNDQQLLDRHVYPCSIFVYIFHQFYDGMMIFYTVAVQISTIFFVPFLFHSWIN